MESRLNFPLDLSEGFTGHHRHLPRRNGFRYPVLYVRFNVADADNVDLRLRKALKVFSFRPTDYLEKDHQDLNIAIRAFLDKNVGFHADQIELITIPRLFGYAFNPVSFWFCRRNGKLEGVLSEVNNTFGERHFYWVQPSDAGTTTVLKKQFHVSPFLPVNGQYEFRFHDDVDRTRIEIDYFGENSEKVLSTWLSLKHQSIESARTLPLLLRYGWITVLVVIRIHLQAVKLWFKRISYFTKPNPPSKKVTR